MTRRTLLIAAAVFVAPWLIVMVIDAVAFLRWPNPLAWEPGFRGVAMVCSLWLAAWALILKWGD